MKPHRRKDTPPRRENPDASGQHPDGEVSQAPDQGAYDAAPGETAPAPETPPPAYQDPGQMQYDPGQALVDPGASYPEPQQAPADPGQAYPDPNQAYVDPNQAYADPGQAYVDPNQAYGDPNQGYSDPGRAFVDPPVPTPPPVGSAPPAQLTSPAPRRKVVTKRSGGRRPVKGGRPGSRYQKPQPNYGGGVSVMGVFLFLVAIAMMVIVTFVVMPKDVSHVKGYPIDPLKEKKDQRNLLDEAQKVMVSRDKDLVISEAEVNAYLNHRLQGEQTGMMAALVKFRGIYVDFTPGFAEVIVERELLGLPITMTARVKPELFQRQVIYRPAGWSIGKIEFTSRNIKPIIGMFQRIRISCQEEFNTMKQMADVRFEEDKVILDATL
jgi:hypothetical protein